MLKCILLLLSISSRSLGEKIQCQDDIDTYLNNLNQDDPELIDQIKNYYLTSPAPLDIEYNIPAERLQAPLINGQFKQALIVDLFYNSSKSKGFFIEAGAYDGFTLSNSLYFEAFRNWTGLLVEAHPDNYEALTLTNRKSWSVGTCLSTQASPEVVLFDAATIFGGIIQEGRPKPGDSLPSNRREEMQKLTEKTRRTIQMQCLPLYSLLLGLGNPTVDYMSLDIEGAEEAVLKTLPWDKVDIQVIGLEIITEKHDEEAKGTHVNAFPAIVEFLTSKGYELIRSDWHTVEKKSMEAYFAKKVLADRINPKYKKIAE